MNTIDVSVEGVEPPRWLHNIERFCLNALETLGYRNWEVSILLCDRELMRGLNLRYRGRDESTDVLSFSQNDGGAMPQGSLFHAGDIVISLDDLARNVHAFSVGEEEELKRLIVHGLLHLGGMDHSDNDPEQEMLRLQEATLTRLTEERIF